MEDGSEMWRIVQKYVGWYANFEDGTKILRMVQLCRGWLINVEDITYHTPTSSLLLHHRPKVCKNPFTFLHSVCITRQTLPFDE